MSFVSTTEEWETKPIHAWQAYHYFTNERGSICLLTKVAADMTETEPDFQVWKSIIIKELDTCVTLTTAKISGIHVCLPQQKYQVFMYTGNAAFCSEWDFRKESRRKHRGAKQHTHSENVCQLDSSQHPQQAEQLGKTYPFQIGHLQLPTVENKNIYKWIWSKVLNKKSVKNFENLQQFGNCLSTWFVFEKKGKKVHDKTIIVLDFSL